MGVISMKKLILLLAILVLAVSSVSAYSCSRNSDYTWLNTPVLKDATYNFHLSPNEKARAVAGCCEPDYNHKVAIYPWYTPSGEKIPANYPYYYSPRAKARAVSGCCEPNYDFVDAKYPWLNTPNHKMINNPWLSTPKQRMRECSSCY